MRSRKVHGSVMERVWAKFERQPNGCWLWTASTTRDGYPMLSSTAHRTVHVHRWIYETLVEPIPDGYEVDHLCRTPACVNPAHLEAVTGEENRRRKHEATTHCRRGHPYNAANTRTVGLKRVCRVCARERERARRLRGEVA